MYAPDIICNCNQTILSVISCLKYLNAFRFTQELVVALVALIPVIPVQIPAMSTSIAVWMFMVLGLVAIITYFVVCINN